MQEQTEATRKGCNGDLGRQVLAWRSIGNEEPQAGCDKHQQHDF